jgi:hypothetical protein
MRTFNQRSFLHITVLLFSSLQFTSLLFNALHFTTLHSPTYIKDMKATTWDFLLTKAPTTVVGPTQPRIKRIPGSTFPEVKRCVMQATNCLRLFQKLKERIYVYISTYISMAYGKEILLFL